MKKMAVLMFSLFILDGAGQAISGLGQTVGNIVTLKEPGYDSKVESARWAGHYDYVEFGNDASGMASSG